jgi:Flp pilus assembly protein TadD
MYSLNQKWEKSVTELEVADNLFPNHPEILRCLGWSFYNENRKNQGIAVLERSKTLSPTDPNILCDLGVCYMNSADFDKAQELFEQVIKIDPQSEQGRESLDLLKMLRFKRLKKKSDNK